MKRKIISLLCLCASVFAATDAQIIDYFKTQIPEDVDIKVEKRVSIEDLDGIEFIKVRISGERGSQFITVFAKDDLVFPEIINIKNMFSYKKKIEREDLSITLRSEVKKESLENFVVLGNDDKKETVVVFTDPECPHCAQKIQTIEDSLKQNNIKLILTPAHGKSALEKSALIYRHTKNAKNDKEKIKIIKKYFDPKIKINEKVSEKEIKKMAALKKKYFSLGLRSVPFILNEK